MSRSFVKLFSTITESTVWSEPHATRIVWITMLAMADRHGDVSASIPGLANRARVTVKEAEAALERFLAPDKYSRTPDHEGRRIEVVDGGWRLLNYAKYREQRDDDVRREQNRDAKRRQRQKSARPLTISNVSQSQPRSAQADADAEAEETPSPLSGGTPPDGARAVSQGGEAATRRTARAVGERVLAHLNAKAGTRFEAVEANMRLLVARQLYDGATEASLVAVVNAKVAEAERGDFPRKYLRPSTLFNAEKFAQYAGQIGGATTARGAGPDMGGAWWRTDASIIAQAESLGVRRDGEPLPLVRARVHVALGEAPDERDATVVRLVEELRAASASTAPAVPIRVEPETAQRGMRRLQVALQREAPAEAAA